MKTTESDVGDHADSVFRAGAREALPGLTGTFLIIERYKGIILRWFVAE